MNLLVPAGLNPVHFTVSVKNNHNNTPPEKTEESLTVDLDSPGKPHARFAG
jgi:hypothetical protein